MLKSWHLYRHQEPPMFYGDHIAGDKQFFQETISSLIQTLFATTVGILNSNHKHSLDTSPNTAFLQK